MLESTPISCGVRELLEFGGADSPEEFLLKSIQDSEDFYYSPLTTLDAINFKFFIFSDKTAKGSNPVTGTKFAKWVVKNKLGTIISSAIRTNPNSGNKIRVWIWDIDRLALLKWYKAHGKDLDKELEDFDNAISDSFW